MRKVIAAINMTLDGVCDHTVGIVDEKLHKHYSDLINNGGVILYGRTTFELMKFWQTYNPSGKKSMDDFAISIDNIPKIVFSRTLKDTSWESAKISDKSLDETSTCSSFGDFPGGVYRAIRSVGNSIRNSRGKSFGSSGVCDGNRIVIRGRSDW